MTTPTSNLYVNIEFYYLLPRDRMDVEPFFRSPSPLY